MRRWSSISFILQKGEGTKVSNEITGPVDKVTNVTVDLGPRMVMAGNEVLGTVENTQLFIGESTKEELEKLKAANEIRLVKMLGENVRPDA